jgi:hypothetical protein
MADFLCISPWKAEDIRSALRRNQVNWAVAQAEQLGLPKVLYINIDDSLGEKDKNTHHLEPVDWFHDHSESTQSKPVFKNAFCYLVATLRVGKMVVTVDLRVPRPNRAAAQSSAPSGPHSFRSKNSLAKSILEALHPLLPTGWVVFVQFDSWYASEQLIKYVRRQGWHVTCGLKHNRKLNKASIRSLPLQHRRYTSFR